MAKQIKPLTEREIAILYDLASVAMDDTYDLEIDAETEIENGYSQQEVDNVFNKLRQMDLPELNTKYIKP